MKARIEGITNIKTNMIALCSAFEFGDSIVKIKNCFKPGGVDFTSLPGAIKDFGIKLIKFSLSLILLLEPFIEMAMLSYVSVLLTAAMPLPVAILANVLLISFGSYVLIFNSSSNILHGFMPAFLAGKKLEEEIQFSEVTPTMEDQDDNSKKSGQEKDIVEEDNNEQKVKNIDEEEARSTAAEERAKDLAESSVVKLCFKLAYLALRVILVAFTISFLVTQLHSIAIVAALVAQSGVIVPALELTGIYLAALLAGLIIATLYSKISGSATSSKESNAMLVATTSVVSMLCAFPLSVYLSAPLLGVALPLLIVSTGVMRTAFVAALLAAASSKESNAMLVAITSVVSILCSFPLSLYLGIPLLAVALPLIIVSTGLMHIAFRSALYVAGDDLETANSSEVLDSSSRFLSQPNAISSPTTTPGPKTDVNNSSVQQNDQGHKYNGSSSGYTEFGVEEGWSSDGVEEDWSSDDEDTTTHTF